jgi:hypothetical protein
MGAIKKLMENLKSYEYLGWANDWVETPKIIVEAEQSNIEILRLPLGHCETLVVCHGRKFYYKIDSSD